MSVHSMWMRRRPGDAVGLEAVHRPWSGRSSSPRAQRRPMNAAGPAYHTPGRDPYPEGKGVPARRGTASPGAWRASRCELSMQRPTHVPLGMTKRVKVVPTEPQSRPGTSFLPTYTSTWRTVPSPPATISTGRCSGKEGKRGDSLPCRRLPPSGVNLCTLTP